MARFLFLLIALVLFSSRLFALEVRHQLSSQWVRVGDSAQLKISLNGADQPALLELPQIKGLLIEQEGPPSMLRQTSIINGHKTEFRGYVYNLSLTGLKAGSYQIPAIELILPGGVERIPPFEFLVKEPLKPDQVRTKLEVKLPKERIFQGELVPLTLDWYALDSVQDYRLSLSLLEHDDFHVIAVEPQGKSIKIDIGGIPLKALRDEVMIGKENWARFRFTFLIQPLAAGTYEFPPATAQVRMIVGFEEGRDFFGRLVRQPVTERQFAQSEPVALQVLALPEPRPVGFSGLVGATHLSAETKHHQLQEGDPIPLTVRVNSEGNLADFGEEDLLFSEEFLQDFEILEPPKRLSPGEEEGEGIGFSLTLRAKKSGHLRIPGLEASYFDPKKKAYQIARSAPIELDLAKAERLQAKDLITYAPELPQEKERPQAARPPKDLPQEGPYVPWGLLGLILPILILAGNALAQRLAPVRERQRETKRNRERLSRLQAEIQSFLAPDDKLERDAAKKADRLAQALRLFLQERHGLKPGEASGRGLAERLEEGGMPQELARQAEGLLEALDRQRYRSSGEQSLSALAEEALLWARSLETANHRRTEEKARPESPAKSVDRSA